jgi:hypothetical protein
VGRAVGTLVALVGTIAAALGGFALLGQIYVSFATDRPFATEGPYAAVRVLATPGLLLLGTCLFVAGYWVRFDKAALRQLLTEELYRVEAILRPTSQGGRSTRAWGAYLPWFVAFAIGYSIDGFVGSVAVGLGVLVVAQLLLWVHELGHWFCAVALGMRPWLIVVGEGPQRVMRFRGARVYWGLLPTHGWIGIDRLDPRRWRGRLLALYSGGLLASAAALCVLAALCGALFDRAAADSFARLAWVVMAFCFVGLLLSVVVNALPNRVRVSGFYAHTDGFWILNAPRLPDEHMEFVRHSMALHQLSFGLLDKAPHDVSEHLHDFLQDPRPDAFRAKAMDLVASRGVFHRTPEWLQLADECISEALTLYPDQPTLRLTQGLIRAERGDLEDARPDLELAYAELTGSQRGIAAAYIALVRSEAGEQHEAFLEEAERLGADEWAFRRAEAAIRARRG